MYLCNSCKRMFYTTMEYYIEGEWYPEPFNRGGSVFMGGDCYVDVCPHCQSESFEEIEFDGNCPHCLADLPNITKFVFNDDVHLKCPKCECEFIIDEFGDIQKENEEN